MDTRRKTLFVLGVVVIIILVLAPGSDQRDLVAGISSQRWESRDCPMGRNFWIGCDLCKCNPGGLRLCAGMHCRGTDQCPPIPRGAKWLYGACGERCVCEKGTRIIHCQRYCPITDGYHFYPHAQWA